ncbi:MAG TPA: PHP domain-containing protein [Phycisphaerae bacterium]|nr:PHP domain-containing protein [Phycisphaerae bacterium]
MDQRIKPAFSHHDFLARAGAAVILVAMGWWLPCHSRADGPYEGGVWLAGDHHIHTKYSPDGQYEIEAQVAKVRQYGLSWCVITDHGGPMHDKVALTYAYPELVAARKKHPSMHVFQGLEWNIPAAEHGSVILPPTPDEAMRIAEFEARFDQKNKSRENTPADTEADAVRALQYLQSMTPRPLFFVNHPARTGRVSPTEFRNWSDAGPNVVRGFEGAPGHQAATLVGHTRGEYSKKIKPDAWQGYPKESFKTWGGYDWYVATVGGLWDSLLGEGRAWYITANSDSHRHWTDATIVDTSTYETHGHVTATDRKADHHDGDRDDNIDFFPGEYTKTWVYAASGSREAVLDALRHGNMFTVHGDLIDRLEFSAHAADAAAPMGGTLVLDKNDRDVEVRIRLRPATGQNFGGGRPILDHIDLIVGDILGPANDRETIVNPTTRVVARVPAKDLVKRGDWLVFHHRFDNVKNSFYVRIRGTNRDVQAPEMDGPKVNPWDDLWFYSNPIMVRAKLQ